MSADIIYLAGFPSRRKDPSPFLETIAELQDDVQKRQLRAQTSRYYFVFFTSAKY